VLESCAYNQPRAAVSPRQPKICAACGAEGINGHYAEVFAERFRGVPGHPYEQGFDLRLVPEKLEEPLKWKAPRLIFVNSMSDLFQQGVQDDYVIRVARVMNTANWHTFQVLTKRAERMRRMLNSKLRFSADSAHIWWGGECRESQAWIAAH
jgi:protein gp37